MWKKTFTCILVLISLGLAAQIPSQSHYDSKKLHLLIQLTGLHLYASNQGLIDMDSAMVLACKSQSVSNLLSYDEGIEDGKPTPGRSAIERADLASAKAMIPTTYNTQRIKLLLHLGAFYLFKTGTDKNDLSSAFRYFNQAWQLSDSLRLPAYQHKSLSMLARYYEQAGDYEKSKAFLVKVNQACTRSEDTRAMADAFAVTGTYLPYQDPEKLSYLEKSLALYRKINDKEKEIEISMKILTIHFIGGQMDLAKDELLKTLGMQKAIGFKHIHYTHAVLTYIHMLKGERKHAIYHGWEGIKVMEATRDTTFASYFYLHMGNVYAMTHQSERAIYYYQKSMDKSLNQKGDPIWYKGFLSAAVAMAASGKSKKALKLIIDTEAKFPPVTLFDKMIFQTEKAWCYYLMGQLEESEKYYIKAISYADQIHLPNMEKEVSRVYVETAALYAAQNKYELAAIYLKKAKSFPNSTYSIYIEKSIYTTEYKIDSAAGKYKQALATYQKFKMVNDSVFDIQRSKENQELQIQYETVKKEQDIKLLQNQGLLQQSRLKQADLEKNLTLGGISLLLIIVGLLFNGYRIKQKSNSILESQQVEISQKNNSLENLVVQKQAILEEKDHLITEKQNLIVEKEWLLKEIHHRVKNNLQIVMSLLNSQSEFIGNNEALLAIRESQHRVQAIAIIHQKLYQSNNSAVIAMKEYIPELVNYLKDSFTDSGNIHFKLEIDLLFLDVSQAVPLGLIINEAVTNVIKYAFPDNRRGEVKITMRQCLDLNLQLIIADNGVGLPDGFEISQIQSLGLSLIQGLSEQLGGFLQIENENGLTLTVRFQPDEKYQS